MKTFLLWLARKIEVKCTMDWHYLQRKNHAERIVMLVQYNPDFFDAHMGQWCLEAAADTLERLIKESKTKKQNELINTKHSGH